MKTLVILSLVFLCFFETIYSQAGKLDPLFGYNGIVKTNIGSSYHYESKAKKVLLDPNGSIYYLINAAGNQSFISKRLPNGSNRFSLWS